MEAFAGRDKETKERYNRSQNAETPIVETSVIIERAARKLELSNEGTDTQLGLWQHH